MISPALSSIPGRRLRVQGVSSKPFATAAQVVEHLVAVQSQDFPGARWALGIRMNGASDAQIEKAYNDGAILRTHVLRPTWHFVTPADIRWLLELTAPRVHILNGTGYRRLELDARVLAKIRKTLEKALEGGRYRTRDELRPIFEKAGIVTAGEQRMTYMMMYAELEGLMCSGPRVGKQFTYALLEERAPESRRLGPDEAAAELALRFFRSRGPATVDDLAKWSGLTKKVARNGLEDVRSQLQTETILGKDYFFAEFAGDVIEDRSAYLLSIYDEYVSGYKDRGAIIERESGLKLIGLGNALTSIVVIDGLIVGTWKRTLTRSAVVVTTDIFIRLNRRQKRELDLAIDRYAQFIGLPRL